VIKGEGEIAARCSGKSYTQISRCQSDTVPTPKHAINYGTAEFLKTGNVQDN
jgi:hypothetical protein